MSFSAEHVDRQEQFDKESIRNHFDVIIERARAFDNAANAVDRKYYSFFKKRAFRSRKHARRLCAMLEGAEG